MTDRLRATVIKRMVRCLGRKRTTLFRNVTAAITRQRATYAALQRAV